MMNMPCRAPVRSFPPWRMKGNPNVARPGPRDRKGGCVALVMGWDGFLLSSVRREGKKEKLGLPPRVSEAGKLVRFGNADPEFMGREVFPRGGV